jgi:hypothetical protein
MNIWLAKGIFWGIVWSLFTLAWTLVNPIFGAIAGIIGIGLFSFMFGMHLENYMKYGEWT